MSLKDHPEAIIELSQRDLDEIIEGAAERGANRALKALGLNDPEAVRDVNELRSLLQIWRDARKTAIQTVVKTVMTALLGLLALGAAIKLGVLGDISPKP